MHVLAGEPLEDIPGMEWDAEPFANFAAAPVGWVQRGWFHLGFFAQLLFIVHFVWGLVRDPKECVKHVYVPKTFLEAEKKKIMEELKEAGSEEWVGSSDVLVAWWLQNVYKHRTDPTPLHLHIPVNLRDYPIFPTPSGNMDLPYINNAVLSIHVAPFAVNTLGSTPLREIALRIRRAIIAYNNDVEGVRNDVGWRIANPGIVPFPCPPGATFSLQSSWRAAQFGKLDFSGAMPAPRPGEGRKPKVFLVTSFATGKNMPLRESGAVEFENEDCIWMNEVRGEKDWEAIRRAGSFNWR
uniref:Uncharacterized protein n=1 Tax=Mycena chlorophos TaxID=658473 RepID=A0ABQ0L0F7_MYCCL|nr:predicted protein [Mycena chlorophos]